MRREEKRAEEYLKSLNLGEVTFEPHGNVAPDFEIASTIAVEVRRLNQNYENGGKIRGLEEDQIPLIAKIKKLLDRFKEPHKDVEENSWFLHLAIRHRPLDPWQMLSSRLTEFLEFFYLSDRSQTSYRLSPNLEVSLIPASKPLQTFYRLGGFSDYDAGGWLISELIRNIALCIEDKSHVLDSLGGYRERWLLLIDHVGYGHHEEFSIDRHGWDKVILLAPEGQLHAYAPLPLIRPKTTAPKEPRDQ